MEFSQAVSVKQLSSFRPLKEAICRAGHR